MGDMLSQEEISALLGQDDTDTEFADGVTSEVQDSSSLQLEVLEDMNTELLEKASAVLSSVLNKPTEISNPKIRKMEAINLSNDLSGKKVTAEINYTNGVEGLSFVLANENDAKVLANLMLGRQVGADADDDSPLTDIQLSAVEDPISQSLSATNDLMSKMTNIAISAETPKLYHLDFNDFDASMLKLSPSDEVFLITYDLVIDGLVNTTFDVVSTANMKSNMADSLIQNGYQFSNGKTLSNGSYINGNNIENKEQTNDRNVGNATPSPNRANNQNVGNGTVNTSQARVNSNMSQNVNAMTAEFQELLINEVEQQKENMSLIMDVPLEVTVEMGRVSRKIKDILEFSPGSIVELDKLAGDPIDILVNGKFIAKGEVVVIDENYGIRITDIVNVNNRI